MNNRMQDELDHEDAKKMGLLERRIREVAKQKKITPRAYYSALVSVICDFAINLGIPKKQLLKGIGSAFDAIEKERGITKH